MVLQTTLDYTILICGTPSYYQGGDNSLHFESVCKKENAGQRDWFMTSFTSKKLVKNKFHDYIIYVKLYDM